jgi:cobalt/nickel transport system permease protein
VHIPDGYLGPQTYAVLDVAIVPICVIAGAKVKRSLKAKQVPLMALAAAFSFVIMMFNVPVIGGSTGHAVGATLIAILLGPWAAVIAVSIALVIQAVVFGDGGVLAFGANAINMAVIMPFVGFYLYRLVAGDAPTLRRRVAAAGIGSWVAIVVASIVAGVEFGIQPLIAHTASGQPLYSPYPLNVAVPAMALEHMLFFGPLEAVVTMGIVAVLAREDSALLAMRPAAKPLRWLWAGLAALLLLTPIGALAGGTAWGEWSAAQLRSSLGYVPAGLQRLGHTWTALMPRYAPGFARDPRIGYLVAAVIGSALVVGVTWVLARVLAGGEDEAATGSGSVTAAPGSERMPAAPKPVPAPAALSAPGAGQTRTRRRSRRSLARRTANAIGSAVSEVLENDELATSRGLMQSLDPRIKLVSIVVFAVTVSFVHSLPVLVALVLVTVALAAASGVPVGSFAAKVWSSAGLFALLLAAPAVTAWITPGAAVVRLGPVSITAPGLLVAARLIARVVAGAGFGLLVVWTTRWSELLHALSALGVPDLVVATLAMTQKQIMSLLRTVENMHLARESRMLSPGTARDNRGWVVERMAFVARRSIKTADDVYDAMLARGFSGSMPSLVTLRATAADWAWLACSVAVCALTLGIDRMVFPT